MADQKCGSLPAIAYSVLVAHFLQQTSPPVLPILPQLHEEGNPETFPLPQDIDIDNFKSSNQQSLGDLWLEMLRFFAYEFDFGMYTVNVNSAKPVSRAERATKKMAIIDPFSPKRTLSRTLSNAVVSDHIIDRLFKILCLYFSLPQLKYGPLFFTLTSNNRLVKESRYRSSLTKRNKNSTDSGSDYEDTLNRLEVMKENGRSFDTDSEDETRSILSSADLKQTLDTIVPEEAIRIMKFLKQEDFIYKFEEEIFTRGEAVPIYCALCQKEGHTKKNCSEEKLPDLLPLPSDDEELQSFLSEVLSELHQSLQPTDNELQQRDTVVQKLQYYIRKDTKYKNAVLQLFGSSANGFGFKNSDLDVCITFQQDEYKDDADQNFLIQDLCSILRKSREFTEVHSIPSAKVPIVKFRCIDTKLEGDVSLYNTLALRNTQLLRTYTNIDPRVKVRCTSHLLIASLVFICLHDLLCIHAFLFSIYR